MVHYLEIIPVPILSIDSVGHVYSANRRAGDALGLSLERLRTMRLPDLLADRAGRTLLYSDWLAYLSPSAQAPSVVVAYAHPDGDMRHFAVTASIFADNSLLIALSPSSADAAPSGSDALLRAAYRRLPLPAIIYDLAGVIRHVTEASAHRHGYTVSELVGQSGAVLFSADKMDRIAALRETLLRVGVIEGIVAPHQHRDGSALESRMSLHLVSGDDGVPLGFVAYVSDGASHAAGSATVFDPVYCPITGLPNRGEFILAADRELAAHPAVPASVIEVVLQGLDDVSGTLGYRAVEAIIQYAAARVRSNLPPGMLLARLSFNGFVLQVPGMDATQALPLALHIESLLQQAYYVEGRPVWVGSGVGLAAYPEHGRQTVALLRCSLVAAHVGIQRSPSVAVYDPLRDLHSWQRQQVAADMLAALYSDRFTAWYQPIVRAHDGNVFALHLSATWQHPTAGLISSADVISMVVASGRGTTYVLMLLRRALRDWAIWREQGYTPRLSLEVPLNALYDPLLIPQMRAILSDGVHEERPFIHVTLPGDVADQPLHSVRSAIIALTDLGVHVTLAQGSKGPHDLRNVPHLPATIEAAELDAAALASASESGLDRSVLGGMISMLHHLGLYVRVRGVATLELWHFLAMRGVLEVQGPVVSEPVAAPHLLDLLRAAPWRARAPALDGQWGDDVEAVIIYEAASHRLVSASAAACAMLGYTTAQLMEMTGDEVIEPQSPGMADTRLPPDDIPTVRVIERVLRRRDGSRFMAEVVLRRLPNAHVQAVLRNVSWRRDLRRRLSQHIEALALVNQAIIVLGMRGHVLEANPAAQRMLLQGAFHTFSRQEDGEYYARSLANDDESWDVFLPMLQKQESYEREMPIHHADGMHGHAVLMARLARDDLNQPIGVVVVVQDVTQYVHAMQQAQKASLEKTQFLSRASHELRTPLNAILGFGQLLEMDDTLSDTQREATMHVLAAGKHLLDLIDDLLDISRIEEGHLRLDMEPVRLADLADELEAMVVPALSLSTIHLDMSDWRSSPLVVWADRRRLAQVLLNLLTNAVKYNRPNGSVTCRVGVVDTMVRIDVHDTGWGMALADVERLFTPFERLGAEAGMVQGTGLGLALCKQLVEAMGGTIGATSQQGVGSTFWIELAPAHER